MLQIAMKTQQLWKISNQTNINQYDLINGLEPDEIDSITQQ
jgi:hypothetical protein